MGAFEEAFKSLVSIVCHNMELQLLGVGSFVPKRPQLWVKVYDYKALKDFEYHGVKYTKDGIYEMLITPDGIDYTFPSDSFELMNEYVTTK